MEIIQAIKAEVERLKAENRGIKCKENSAYCEGYDDAFYDLIPFLSTLGEQAKYKVRNPIFDGWLSRVNPKVREEVRENIDRMLEDDSLIDEIKNFIKEYGYERGEDKLLIAIVARHFYELGCRRTAEKYDEIEYNRQRAEGCVPNDLEEAAIKYADTIATDAIDHDFHKTTFIAGAKWQAEQLLKSSPLPEDTVLFNKGVEEGKRLMLKEAVEGNYDSYPAAVYLDAPIQGIEPGDTVRVIVLRRRTDHG